jgi:hypothetical protein
LPYDAKVFWKLFWFASFRKKAIIKSIYKPLFKMGVHIISDSILYNEEASFRMPFAETKKRQMRRNNTKKILLYRLLLGIQTASA